MIFLRFFEIMCVSLLRLQLQSWGCCLRGRSFLQRGCVVWVRWYMIHRCGCGVSFYSCGSVFFWGGLLSNKWGVLFLSLSSLWFLIEWMWGLVSQRASYCILLFSSTAVYQLLVGRGLCLMVGEVWWCIRGQCIVFLRRRWGICTLTVSMLVLGWVGVEIFGVPILYSLAWILWRSDPYNFNIFPTLLNSPCTIHSDDVFFL